MIKQVGNKIMQPTAIVVVVALALVVALVIAADGLALGIGILMFCKGEGRGYRLGSP